MMRYEKKVRYLHTDGGTEFEKLIGFLENEGCTPELSNAGIPEPNGLAECRNRSLFMTTRCLLFCVEIVIYATSGVIDEFAHE